METGNDIRHDSDEGRIAEMWLDVTCLLVAEVADATVLSAQSEGNVQFEIWNLVKKITFHNILNRPIIIRL